MELFREFFFFFFFLLSWVTWLSSHLARARFANWQGPGTPFFHQDMVFLEECEARSTGIAKKGSFFFFLPPSSLSLSLSEQFPLPPALYYCLLLCHIPAGERKWKVSKQAPSKEAHGRQQAKFTSKRCWEGGLSAGQRGCVFETEPKASAEERC